MGTQQYKNIGPRGMGVATTCAAGFGEGIWKIEKNWKLVGNLV
jgi:hypothetical protein